MRRVTPHCRRETRMPPQPPFAAASNDASALAALAGYSAPDYLARWGDQIDSARIQALRAARLPAALAPKLRPLREALAALPVQPAQHLDCAAASVEIGTAGELDAAGHAALAAAIAAFVPWKKGPFNLFGTKIDAEWRSDQKWARVLPHIAPLAGRRVADIGCHNGYFLLRMAAAAPAVAIGFEPVARHWLNFHLLQRFAQRPELHHEPLGVEHVDLYPGFFDTIFCMGILYHHTDPVGLLRKLLVSLAPGGELIIDCQGIPGESSTALVPAGKYARAGGVWFLPTQSCLLNWIKRAGFDQASCFYAAPLAVEEQRATAHAPIASLAEALDPQDSGLTVEGYPAPWRFYVRAARR